MGMFSWVSACDAKESIANVYSSRPVRTVYLLQPGGAKPIKEECYEGYGLFGGVDAYVWLAEKNAEPLGIDLSKMDFEAKRILGITLECQRGDEVVYPLKFSFNPDAKYEDLPASEQCPDQGFIFS